MYVCESFFYQNALWNKRWRGRFSFFYFSFFFRYKFIIQIFPSSWTQATFLTYSNVICEQFHIKKKNIEGKERVWKFHSDGYKIRGREEDNGKFLSLTWDIERKSYTNNACRLKNRLYLEELTIVPEFYNFLQLNKV